MYLPGGLRYDGAALGFNALVIAASGNAEGAIVPWRAAIGLPSLSILYDKVAGTSSSVSLQVRGLDFDGQTTLAGYNSIANTVPDDAFFRIAGTLLLGTGGTLVAATAAILLTAPYARFRIINNDAVNNVTVTLQAILDA